MEVDGLSGNRFPIKNAVPRDGIINSAHYRLIYWLAANIGLFRACGCISTARISGFF
jgi:hypothetical protein